MRPRLSTVWPGEENRRATITNPDPGALRGQNEDEAPTETTPAPPTLPSVDPKKPVGKKFDTGKTRTDLLPMGAVHEMGTALALIDDISRAPWSTVLHELSDWRRGRKHTGGVCTIAVVAACLAVLLTRDLVGDVRASQLLPTCGPALFEVSKVLTFGASKYGANNWQGLDEFTNRYYAAILRHLFAYGGGERIDPESGLPHLAHALCGALFLLSSEVGHDPT